jgi:hypothetical protein
MLAWEDPTVVHRGHRLAAGEHRRARDRPRCSHANSDLRGPANANRCGLAHSHPAFCNRDYSRREHTVANGDGAAADAHCNAEADIHSHGNAHADPNADARAARHANTRANS